jgi:hypothetical protein
MSSSNEEAISYKSVFKKKSGENFFANVSPDLLSRTAMALRASTNGEYKSRTVPRQAGLPIALRSFSWKPKAV